MPGRHRRNLRRGLFGAAAAGVAVIVVLTGTWFAYQQVAGDKCTGQIKLNVAAATEIAAAVDQVAQKWTANGGKVGETCVAVAVSAVSPATMAAVVARQHRVELPGLGAAPTNTVVPDVWIPDSTTWLLRLQSDANGFVPTDGRPVAQSPVVLAAPAPIAQKMGWPTKKLGWKDLLAQVNSRSALQPGIVDPARDATGLNGLLALGAAAGDGEDAAKAKVGALRALAADSSSIRDDLMQKFPHSAADVGTGLAAAPVSEQDVIAYNTQKPPVELAAMYLQPAPIPLDYPYSVMPEVDLPTSTAAAQLHKVLNGGDFHAALARAGLRGPDGVAGPGFPMPEGGPAAAGPVPAADAALAAQLAAAISQLLGSWAAVTQPGRVLAVFDVSGSMLEKVPTAGGQTRAQVTQKAAGQGLALFDDRWEVGNWVFSTNMVGTQPWKELVPITPLSTGRAALQAAIPQMSPKKDGDTGLYDTALAAYKEVRDTWEAGRVNSVIIFTDGQNDNPDGITQGQLLSQLRKLRDPRRPVRMVIIGIGTGVDGNELKAIAGATSAGGVFIAEDPAKIADIFLAAIASRSGA